MDLEAFEEASDAIEKVNKRVVTRANFLGRLAIDLIVKREI